MKRELNKFLKTLSDKELIKEVRKLYDKFPDVQSYYAMELGQDTEAIVAKYKERIWKEYFPKRGFGKARSSVSNKVIAEFRKIAVHKKDIVELLLYRTEAMLDFTNAYGDIDEQFYNSMGTSFRKACELISKECLESHYREYCQRLVNEASGFGWGVYDELDSYYQDCFGNG